MDCFCQHCATPLEAPDDMEDTGVDCPACGRVTLLAPLPDAEARVPIAPRQPSSVLPEVTQDHPLAGLFVGLSAVAGLVGVGALLFWMLASPGYPGSVWVAGLALGSCLHFALVGVVLHLLAHIRWLLKRLVEQGMLRGEESRAAAVPVAGTGPSEV